MPEPLFDGRQQAEASVSCRTGGADNPTPPPIIGSARASEFLRNVGEVICSVGWPMADDGIRHNRTKARGGALIATRYDVAGDPVEIAHIVVGRARAKGGGASIQTYHKAQYDPSTAADILKAKFVDKSTALGVDLKFGSLTYQSPVGLSVGSGKFPYQLSASVIWRGGSPDLERQVPTPSFQPQEPWTTNWASSASFSSSVSETFGRGDLRASAGTIAAFLAMQDIYRTAPAPEREAAAVLAASWWLGTVTGNVVTLNVGADTRQFVRLANGQWIAPGGSPAKLDIVGSRTPYIDRGCFTAAPYPQDRGWNYAGMTLALTSPAGDVQHFTHSRVVDIGDAHGCFVQQGFQLTGWSFPQGINLTLDYQTQTSSQQHLLKVSNNLGRSILFTRSGLEGFDNGLTGADRRAVVIGGNVHTGVDGQTYRFEQEVVANRYRLLEVYRPVAPSTPFVRYGYDSQHRVVRVEDAGAVAGTLQPYRFQYAAGLGGARIDPLGGRYDVTYDRDGHLRRVVDELGYVTRLTPDGRGRVVEYRYPMGERQRFTYDRRNNTTSMTRVARPSVLPALPDTRVQVQWHPQLNKPTKVIDAGEGAPRRPVTSFLYDSFGRLTRATDPSGMATRYEYSPANETLTTQVVDDGAAPRLNLTTSFTYDAQGNLTGVVTPRGAVVQAEYNARRQPLYEQSLAGATAIAPQTAATLLARTDWVYDAVGRVEQEKRSSDVPGVPYAITSTLYTATDQPYSVTDPLGRVTVTEYDSLDRPHRVTDPLGRVSEVLYNAGGQKMVEKSAVGTGLAQNSARYLYNPDGSITTITDPRDNILTHGYDAHGRLSLLSYADGKSESYAYDVNDNRTGFTQRDGTVSTTAYDSLNRPTSIKRPGLAETSYGLDILGRVVAERAGTEIVRTHVYDSAGRKQSVNVTLPRPATGVTGPAPTIAMAFTYDASGNRTGATWSEVLSPGCMMD